MTTYLVPESFNAVNIRGGNSPSGLDTQAFELPVPTVKSGIIPVAGGDLFDFNYGNGAKLTPRPFVLIMVCYSNDDYGFQTAFNGFFGIPPVGLYGLTKTFKARVHGSLAFMTAECELESYTFTQDVRWYDSYKSIISGLSVTFRPVEMFS